MESQRIPPGQLLASFLLVACSFVAVYSAMIATIAVVSRWFFPETFEWLTAEQLSPERFREEAAARIPAFLFLPCAAAGGLTAFAAGWFITRRANFAGTAHAVFVAVLLFIGFLQTVATAPAAIRWMPLVLAGLLPIATLLGARLAISGPAVEPSDEPPPE